MPATRLAAAEAVFHSHDPAALPALDRALAKETDAGVKLRMEQARAAALLFSPTHRTRPTGWPRSPCCARAATSTAAALLASLSGQPPAVAEAAAPRSRRSTAMLQLWSILQSVYYGCRLGSVLLLAAAGLAITFGVMGVINMAHGEMVMIGAYVTFMVQQAIRAVAPGLFGASLLIAVPLAFIVAGADRHRDRAHADPLAVRPAAGDAAGDLGPVAGAAAGGALALRRRTTAMSARRTG